MPANVGSGSAIVVATQGHYDELALEAALATEAGYIGLVASARRAETVLGYLRDRGVGVDQLSRIHAPAGIDLGHIEHSEIGVAIIAELVAMRARGELSQAQATVEPPHTAIDPVCQMEVEVGSARWISEHEGETHYFCAPSCKTTFDKDPESYLSKAI